MMNMTTKHNINRILFYLNMYLLMFALPCGMFPIHYYWRTARNEAFSPIPKYTLLLILAAVLILHAMEQKYLNKVRLIYLILLPCILITTFFVLKNTDQYTNGYLLQRLFHAFKYGIVSSLGITFLILSSKKTEFGRDRLLCAIGIVLLMISFLTAPIRWGLVMFVCLCGILHIKDKQEVVDYFSKQTPKT